MQSPRRSEAMGSKVLSRLRLSGTCCSYQGSTRRHCRPPGQSDARSSRGEQTLVHLGSINSVHTRLIMKVKILLGSIITNHLMVPVVLGMAITRLLLKTRTRLLSSRHCHRLKSCPSLVQILSLVQFLLQS